MSKECNCGDARGHAVAVSDAVFRSLFSAVVDPARERHWREHADLLERKFTTGHGRHYSHFMEPPK